MALDERFDPHLAQAESLTTLFVAMHDGVSIEGVVNWRRCGFGLTLTWLKQRALPLYLWLCMMG